LWPLAAQQRADRRRFAASFGPQQSALARQFATAGNNQMIEHLADSRDALSDRADVG
jgi:hypothetical protein